MNKIPVAKVYHGSAGTRVIWRRGKNTYTIRCSKADADKVYSAVTVGLLTGKWSPVIARHDAVIRWRAGGNVNSGDPVADYLQVMAAEVSPQWQRQNAQYIRAWGDYCGNAQTATQAQAAAWLEQNANAYTRNKKLIALKKFYRWAMEHAAWPDNPFDGLKQRTATRSALDIAVYSAAERDAMLAHAATIRRGVAVYIALLAGLRLNEILRLEWSQIDFAAGTLVTQSKRGAARVVPLASRLREYLIPLRQASGRVVGAAGLIGMRRIEARMRRQFPAFHWQTCRHTFCSLLVQAGVSLDKVCAWAGHTPSVARRHYARFVPAAGGDRDIDRA